MEHCNKWGKFINISLRYQLQKLTVFNGERCWYHSKLPIYLCPIAILTRSWIGQLKSEKKQLILVAPQIGWNPYTQHHHCIVMARWNTAWNSIFCEDLQQYVLLYFTYLYYPKLLWACQNVLRGLLVLFCTLIEVHRLLGVVKNTFDRHPDHISQIINFHDESPD